MSSKTDPLPTTLILPNSTLYIANMSEDVWSFIAEISDSKARHHEVEENSLLSDRDLFSFAGNDHVRIILPQPINSAFWQYFESTFGKKDIEIWSPKRNSGQLCLDILNDRGLLKKIKTFGQHTKQLDVMSYTASAQFFELLHKLTTFEIPITTSQTPQEIDSWTVNFYGSKSGIRQLGQQCSAEKVNFTMSEGLITSSIAAATKIAANFYIKHHGVVLKINKGHSGAGMFIWRPGDLPTEFVACEKAMVEQLKQNRYWEKFPIIIEELIDIDHSIGGGTPSVEFKVLQNGQVQYLYYCGMTMTKDGVFKGTEIHEDVLPKKISKQLIEIGSFIGKKYAAQGYRGYFDVDFVVGKNGQLYVTESNVRRTGGTHAYRVAHHLFGKDFMNKTYVVSNNQYQMTSKSIRSFDQLLKKLKPLLFNPATKEGIVLSSANVLAYHQIGYVIFGNTKDHAYQIEENMEQLLST